MSPRIRARFGVYALCLSDAGQSWHGLVMKVALDSCRLVWLSEEDRPQLSRLQLRNNKGEIVEVGAEAISTEHRGKIWFVDCRFGQPLTVKEMLQML